MQKKKTAEELVTNNRAQFVAEASFQVGGPVYGFGAWSRDGMVAHSPVG